MRVESPKIKMELQATADRLTHLASSPKGLPDPVAGTSKIYFELLALCDSIMQRSEKTTHGLMAATSIIESQKAVQQGHEVQKLTELAFVFIPMSFVASYFGVEIKVCWKMYFNTGRATTFTGKDTDVVTGRDQKAPDHKNILDHGRMFGRRIIYTGKRGHCIF